MKSARPSIILTTAAAVATFASAATAGVVTSLGTPTSTHNTIGDLPSWQGNGDDGDATFTSYIDFSSNAGASGQQLIWETGGIDFGSSLVYGPNDTLFMRVLTEGTGPLGAVTGGTVTDLSYQLTANQLGAGELFVAWVFDLGNNEIRLIMDGLDQDNNPTTVATMGFNGTDWSSADAAAFGDSSATNFVGGYNGLTAFSGDPFVSGTINTTEGLDFFRGDALVISPVPEPLGAMAGVAAIGFTCFRRRRELE